MLKDAKRAHHRFLRSRAVNTEDISQNCATESLRIGLKIPLFEAIFLFGILNIGGISEGRAAMERGSRWELFTVAIYFLD